MLVTVQVTVFAPKLKAVGALFVTEATEQLSAVVGVPHEVKGQCIYAFVVLLDGHTLDQKNIQNEINKIIEERIGKLAKPDFVQIVSALPKTRSGKIMRRILRKIGENDNSNFGDTSTLLDPTVVEVIWEQRLIK